MSGNVFEWVNDWHSMDYYKKSPHKNPQGPKNGTEKAVRGGSWNDYENFLRCSERLRAKPLSKYGANIGGFGFRIAYSPEYVLAYSSDESGNPEIYLSDISGNAKLKITNYELRDGYAACSPDGKKIAFYAYYDNAKTWSINTMKIDGSNRKRLTHKQYVQDTSPSWSPDGKQIIFTRAENSIYKLCIMNSDGTNLHSLNFLFFTFF